MSGDVHLSSTSPSRGHDPHTLPEQQRIEVLENSPLGHLVFLFCHPQPRTSHLASHSDSNTIDLSRHGIPLDEITQEEDFEATAFVSAREVLVFLTSLTDFHQKWSTLNPELWHKENDHLKCFMAEILLKGN
jgi:hypothetical protein